MTLSKNDTQHNSTLPPCHYAEYHYAECCSARYNAFKNDLVLTFDYRISDDEVKASKH